MMSKRRLLFRTWICWWYRFLHSISLSLSLALFFHNVVYIFSTSVCRYNIFSTFFTSGGHKRKKKLFCGPLLLFQSVVMAFPVDKPVQSELKSFTVIYFSWLILVFLMYLNLCNKLKWRGKWFAWAINIYIYLYVVHVLARNAIR